MDGNGRWAKERGLPRKLGHKRGAESLKNLLTEGQKLGVEYLTVYAFSAENWGRPEEEITALMGLLGHYLDKESELLIKNQIRLRTIGDLSTFDPELRNRVETLQKKTKNFSALNLTIALSYGSRQEITQAVKQLVADEVDVTENAIDERLYTADLPDIDLLIRTGGEQRLSNFLLWQSAYTELYFTDTYWPDFNVNHLKKAMECFTSRERRFGHV
jgi:undecaprenyl diphosphate synthase